jgi:hypothetical protein
MSRAKPSLQQPDSERLEIEEKRREDAERSARGLLDGRQLKRSRRQFQIGIKTTPETKKKFDRLRVMTGWTYSEIFEYCMEAGAAKFDKEEAR